MPNKKKKENFYFHFDVEIYKQTVYLFFLHNDTEFEKTFSKIFTKEAKESFKKNTTIFELGEAKCSSDGGYTIMRFKQWNQFTIKDIECINHEIFHATHYIMNRIGMMLTSDTGEAFAYLNSFIHAKVYTELTKHCK